MTSINILVLENIQITPLLISIPKLEPQNKPTIIYSFISINLSLFVIIIVFVFFLI